MDVSKFLSKVIGMYLIVVGIGMFVSMQQFITQVNGLINDGPLLFVTGFFTLILGLLMVVSHNIWQWNWRVAITLFSWLVLLKGACVVFCPQFIDKTTLVFVENVNIAYIAAIVGVVIGVLFSYLGFKR